MKELARIKEQDSGNKKQKTKNKMNKKTNARAEGSDQFGILLFLNKQTKKKNSSP